MEQESLCALCGGSSAFAVTHATVLERKAPCKPAKMPQWVDQHLLTASLLCLQSTGVRVGHSSPSLFGDFQIQSLAEVYKHVLIALSNVGIDSSVFRTQHNL